MEIVISNLNACKPEGLDNVFDTAIPQTVLAGYFSNNGVFHTPCIVYISGAKLSRFHHIP